MSVPTTVPMLNVHKFDTHLAGIFDHKNETKYDVNNKIKLFTAVKYRMKREKARAMIDVIINDMKHSNGTKTSKNYDASNKVNCTDILASILNKADHEFVIPVLDEQLEDMYNLGQCPQGRTTRLIQLYNLFI